MGGGGGCASEAEAFDTFRFSTVNFCYFFLVFLLETSAISVDQILLAKP